MTNQQKHSRSIPKALPNYSWITPQVLLRYSQTITNILKSGQSNQSHSGGPVKQCVWLPIENFWKKSKIGATTIQIMKAYKKTNKLIVSSLE